jgi:hypothetical protein
MKLCALLIFLAISSGSFGQHSQGAAIKKYQKSRIKHGQCLDFIRKGDLEGIELESLQQIIIIRHGEPAMEKKGWKNRNEAKEYMEMYDSVGVYNFEQKPVCLRGNDLKFVYTSNLPRAINTAEKTTGDSIPIVNMALFNEFNRKVICFPNIRLPRAFWSVSSRLMWMVGFNNKGIDTFREEKNRSKRAAFFLDNQAENTGKALLFAHGFLNKYVKRHLKNLGYRAINLNGQKYLGAYYFYKIEKE